MAGRGSSEKPSIRTILQGLGSAYFAFLGHDTWKTEQRIKKKKRRNNKELNHSAFKSESSERNRTRVEHV